MRTFLCLVTAFVANAAEPVPPHSALEFYGHDAFEVIRSPVRMEVCLIKDIRNNNSRTIKERTPRIALPPNDAKLVSNVLINDKTYGWDGFKPCVTDFGARLIVHGKANSVTIDFCFECGILSFSGPATASGEEDFDEGSEPLLKVFQKAFPNDRQITKEPR